MGIDQRGCPHLVIMMGKIKGELSDEDFRVYHCMACGFPVLGAPVIKFKNNPEAKKVFDKIAQEIREELPAI